jgi:hypothetical protein
MENTDRLNNYLELLMTRQKIYRRNLVIGGVAFSLALLSTTILLLFTVWNVRTLWLVGLIDIMFVLNLIMAWVRFEIVQEKIELLNHL